MKSKGFTFIEIIVSLFLLCVLSLTFLTMTTFYISTVGRASSRYESVNRVEEILDSVVLQLKESSCTPQELEKVEAYFSQQGINVEISSHQPTNTIKVWVGDQNLGSSLQTLVRIP